MTKYWQWTSPKGTLRAAVEISSLNHSRDSNLFTVQTIRTSVVTDLPFLIFRHKSCKCATTGVIPLPPAINKTVSKLSSFLGIPPYGPSSNILYEISFSCLEISNALLVKPLYGLKTRTISFHSATLPGSPTATFATLVAPCFRCAVVSIVFPELGLGRSSSSRMTLATVNG